MTLIAYVFQTLQTAKDLVRPTSRTSCFRTHFDNQNVKGSQALVNSAWDPFYQIWNWKKSLLVISEILGHFVNTLAADERYSLCKTENFPRMQLLKKQIKCPVSEHPLTVNMLKGVKHLSILHDSTFFTFLKNYDRNFLKKCLS